VDILLLQIRIRNGRRVQQFGKFQHNHGQDGNKDGKVSNPVLLIGSLDFGPQLFFGNGVFARLFLSFLHLLSLSLPFQIGGIDPIIFSHVAPDRGDQWSVFGHDIVVVVVAFIIIIIPGRFGIVWGGEESSLVVVILFFSSPLFKHSARLSWRWRR
jgi:hypothetical protein